MKMSLLLILFFQSCYCGEEMGLKYMGIWEGAYPISKEFSANLQFDTTNLTKIVEHHKNGGTR